MHQAENSEGWVPPSQVFAFSDKFTWVTTGWNCFIATMFQFDNQRYVE